MRYASTTLIRDRSDRLSIICMSQIDEVDFMSVKNKCPWITLNGDHVADSQLCIEYLAK